MRSILNERERAEIAKRVWSLSVSSTGQKIPSLEKFNYFEGLASRKLFIIGTIVVMWDISVTCVVSGTMANLDAERGRRSPGTSPPFRRYISAM